MFAIQRAAILNKKLEHIMLMCSIYRSNINSYAALSGSRLQRQVAIDC